MNFIVCTFAGVWFGLQWSWDEPCGTDEHWWLHGSEGRSNYWQSWQETVHPYRTHCTYYKHWVLHPTPGSYYTSRYICVCACMCTCAWMYVYTCVCVRVCTYVCVYMYDCVHIWLCTCVTVYVCVCERVCACVLMTWCVYVCACELVTLWPGQSSCVLLGGFGLHF